MSLFFERSGAMCNVGRPAVRRSLPGRTGRPSPANGGRPLCRVTSEASSPPRCCLVRVQCFVLLLPETHRRPEVTAAVLKITLSDDDRTRFF